MGMLYFFLIATLSGPSPSILFHLDISDKAVMVLWISFILPYWICLGLFVGMFAWKTRAKEAEPTAPLKKQIRVNTVVFASLMGIFSLISFPSFTSSGSSNDNRIINNLRQLDAAKNQFALEKKTSLDYIPTEADLTPYIRLQDGKLPHVGEERYVLNPIRQAPYAISDKDQRIRRHGFSEGYTITNGTTYHLP